MGITSVSLEGLTSAFNGLNIGNTAASNIVVIILCVLLGFSITRNLRLVSILMLPLALGLTTMGVYAGPLPVALFAVLFAVNTFSIRGMLNMLTATADRVGEAYSSGSLLPRFAQRRRAASLARSDARQALAKERALDTRSLLQIRSVPGGLGLRRQSLRDLSEAQRRSTQVHKLTGELTDENLLEKLHQQSRKEVGRSKVNAYYWQQAIAAQRKLNQPPRPKKPKRKQLFGATPSEQRRWLKRPKLARNSFYGASRNEQDAYYQRLLDEMR